MCTPKPPSNSPLSELMLSESKLRALRGGRTVVNNEFTHFRALLWEYIEVSNDPNTHGLAWNTVDVFGKAALAQYQATGNKEALEQVKNAVKAALDML